MVEQFDPAIPCQFEIVDLTVRVRCEADLDFLNHGCVLSTSLSIIFRSFKIGILAM